MGFRAFGRYVFGTLGNEANVIVQYYFVPCRLSADPKYMTMNDFEWLNGHFTLNFHYCELLLTNCLLLIYIASVYTLVYTRDQRRSAGGGVAERDPQNIWNPRKNCGSFVDVRSSEP